MVDLPPYSISIRQPWAWAIVHAGKDIENRDWATRFRGPVCIHAAKGMTNWEYNKAVEFLAFDRKIELPGMFHHHLSDQRGGIIGVAEIVDCVETSESPWFFGRYGFVLRNARPVDFIPVKGALGIFDWRNQLAGEASNG